MAVPGLQLTDLNEQSQDNVFTVELKRSQEWRFEVPFGQTIKVKLLSGTGEIFGTELSVGHEFSFTGTKSAIYTWHGCVIEYNGSPTVEYMAEESPAMTAYTNLHFALEKLRATAVSSLSNVDVKSAGTGTSGPRVMIIGPEDAGKTSLVKLLTAYAIRHGRKPVVVNLDTREGILSLPGSLTATRFSTILDVEEGFGTSPTTGPSPVPVKLPLVYYYGFETPEKNTKLYKKLVNRLALAVTSKLGEDEESQSSGIIIDTPVSMSISSGYEFVHQAVTEFSVSVLVVVGSERLYSDMMKKYENVLPGSHMINPVTVIKLAKSGGCVDRDESYMTLSRQRVVKEYFFGEPKRTLSPYTVTVDYNSLPIYRLNESTSTQNVHLLPGGASNADEILNQPFMERVEPSTLMHNSVLAVLNCELGEPLDVMCESSVLGFVYVAEVEEQKRRVKILAPVAGRLPNKPLVWGDWPGAVMNLVG